MTCLIQRSCINVNYHSAKQIHKETAPLEMENENLLLHVYICLDKLLLTLSANIFKKSLKFIACFHLPYNIDVFSTFEQ